MVSRKCRAMKPFRLRQRIKTNIGDPAKINYDVVFSDKYTPILFIEKLLLTNNVDVANNPDYKALKTFKGKTLYRQIVIAKLGEIQTAIGLINNRIINQL